MQLVEAAIEGALGEELFVGAFFHDASVLKDEDAVG
ncbi:MAG: hypothetical protein LKKZDAJK_002984, partial [Candidatus Fervidibacter sp.]